MASTFNGVTVNFPPTTNVWGKPRQPTPGSTFNFGQRGLPLQSIGAEILDAHGNLVSGKVTSKLTGITDEQLTTIPRRHSEPRRKAKGKSILTGQSTGSILNGSGIFPSILGENGGSLLSGFNLSSLASSGSILSTQSAVGALQSAFGFDVEGMEDEDELNTVKGYHRNAQVVGPEYLIVTPVDIPCPGQEDILILKISSIKNLRSNNNFFTSNFMHDLQGFGKNFDGHMGFGLASFNYYVACLQYYEQGLSPDAAYDLYKKHKNIIHSFSISGVINSESFATGGSSYQSNLSSYGQNSTGTSNQKTVNVVHQGAVIVRNIFGPIKGGDRVHFIWKKVPAPGSYILDSRKQQMQSTVANKTNTSLKLSQNPFQLVPYVDTELADPPLSELEYVSDHLSWSLPTAPTTAKNPATIVSIPERKPIKERGLVFRFGQINKPSESMTFSQAVRKDKLKAMCNRAISDATVGSDSIVHVFVMPDRTSVFETIEKKVLEDNKLPHSSTLTPYEKALKKQEDVYKSTDDLLQQ